MELLYDYYGAKYFFLPYFIVDVYVFNDCGWIEAPPGEIETIKSRLRSHSFSTGKYLSAFAALDHPLYTLEVLSGDNGAH
jgi:hypothetical protein